MANEVWLPEQAMVVGEARAFAADFVNQGTPTGAGTTTAYDATFTTAPTTLSGSNSLTGTTVTTQLFTPATAQLYQLRVSVTISGNTVYGIIPVRASALAAVTITNGYCTLQEFKDLKEAKSSDPVDDTVIAKIITGVSRWIDTQTGRTFYARTETRTYDAPEDRQLWLDDDLLTVTTLTNGDSTVITTADYFLEPRNYSPKYAVKLKQTSSIIWEVDSSGNSEGAISIAGTWGWSATAPTDINLACLDLVKSYYMRKHGENASSESIITAGGVVITPRDVSATTAKTLEYYRRRV